MDLTFEQHLLAKSRKMRIPLKATMELTPLCNMDCKMCYVHELKNKLDQPIHSVDYWMSLVPALKEMGTLFVTLIGGEPLLYPEIDKLYKLLSEQGFFVSITTNGTLLANGLPEWMVNTKPKYVTVSLYGASDKTYQKVTGNPKGFTQVMNAIKYLEEAEIPIQFNYSTIPENFNDLEEILKFAKDRNHPINASNYCYPSNSRREKDEEERLTPEQSAEAYWKITKANSNQYLEQLIYFANESYAIYDPVKMSKFNCNAGKTQMWISWKGQIGACGIISGMEKPLTRENLSDCWKELVEATEQITTSEKCAKCRRREICKVCPAMMYTETGDFGESPDYICAITEEKVKLAKKLLKQEIEKNYPE